MLNFQPAALSVCTAGRSAAAVLYFSTNWSLPLEGSIKQGKHVTDTNSEWDRLRALDPQALTRVHDRHYPEIFRYSLYRLGDAQAADDITSETFLRLLSALRSRKGPRENLRAWLFGTASHLISDHFRLKKRHAETSLPEALAAQQPDPTRHAQAREHRQRMREALQNLTDEQQQVIALRFGAEMSLAETAAAMGKNPNAIKGLQFRALAALRRQFKEKDQ